MIYRIGSGARPTARLFTIFVLIWLFIASATPGSAGQATPAAISAEDAIAQVTTADGVIQFDVSENAQFFVWSGDPELVDGFPTVGTP